LPPLLNYLVVDRFARPFALDWRPRFFANPCEQAPPDLPDPLETVQATGGIDHIQTTDTPLEVVRRLVAEMTRGCLTENLSRCVIRNTDRPVS
jgi:hypothetical protein